MTEAQNKDFITMQNDLHEVKKIVTSVAEGQEKIRAALLGSDLTKDGGLVQRVIDLEAENGILKKEMDAFRVEAAKNGVYVKAMWAMAGAIVMAIFAYFFGGLKH